MPVPAWRDAERLPALAVRIAGLLALGAIGWLIGGLLVAGLFL